MKKRLMAGLATGLLVFGITDMASAVSYTEVSDAGQTLATAQALPGGTTKITGYISAGDVDMFGFGWGGGAFYVNSVGTTWDSQLFLFGSNGLGIQANDDGISSAGPAYLQLASLAAGNYFLAISGYNNDPKDTNGDLMFQSSPYDVLYGPQTLAPLASWSGGGWSGNYTINFSTTTGDGTLGNTNPTIDPNAPVPEPATMLLFGTGLAGLAAVGRRKAKK